MACGCRKQKKAKRLKALRKKLAEQRRRAKFAKTSMETST